MPGMSQAKLQQFARGLAAHPIARAVGLSLLLHFVGIAGVELGNQLGLWDRSFVPEVFRSRVVEEAQELAQQRQVQEVPLLFVQVDPAQASAEAPESAKFYSSENTVASNPDATVETEQPKVEGAQEVVPQVMDVPRPSPAPPAQANAPPEREVMRPTPEPAPEPTEAEGPGEMQMARAAPRPEPEPVQLEQEQPAVERAPYRSLAQARAEKGLIQGPKMKQEGGVRKASLASNLDVKAMPFGSYDAAFIAAVQARWFSILDQRDYVRNESGRVVLDFRLTEDGRIMEMRVVESSVSEILTLICRRAVEDPAPYNPFPTDLRRQMRNNYRDIRFTFYYHN